jgi:hypothetical protein
MDLFCWRKCKHSESMVFFTGAGRKISTVMSHNKLSANRDRWCSYFPVPWQIFYNRNISYKFYRFIMIIFPVVLFTGAKTVRGGNVSPPPQKKIGQKYFRSFLG